LSKYDGIGTHINHLVEHLLCGYIYPYNTFKNGGHRYPKCAGKAKITEEEIKECLGVFDYLINMLFSISDRKLIIHHKKFLGHH
jgi:hypothetical protein